MRKSKKETEKERKENNGRKNTMTAITKRSRQFGMKETYEMVEKKEETKNILSEENEKKKRNEKN